jgi:hypothetical protein
VSAREPITYRDPNPPAPRVFALRSSGGVAGRAYLTTMVTLTLTVVFYVLSHGRPAVILCAPLLGLAIAWLTGLGPRALEVDAGGVVIRSHLRPARRIAATDLTFHLLPGELVLVGRGGRTVVEIGTDHFPERSMEACAEALREVAGG